MRNIRKFETFDDFLASQESVSGTGKYVEDIWPGFAYVKEKFPDEKFAIYNGVGPGAGNYKFGDVVFYDETDTLKNIYWEDFTPDMGTPIAVVVAEAEMMPDGIARMIALENVSEYEENTGSSDKGGNDTRGETKGAKSEKGDDNVIFMRRVGPKVFTITKEEEKEDEEGGEVLMKAQAAPVSSLPEPDGYWFTPSYDSSDFDENQYWYNAFFHYKESIENGGAAKGSVAGSAPTDISFEDYYYVGGGSLSSDYPIEHCDYPLTNTQAPNEYYDGEIQYYTISPYTNQEGQINTAYTTESGTTANDGVRGWNALSDFSGFTWSNMMKNKQEFCYAACNDYHTVGTNVGDWYVPALGESAFVAARWEALGNILNHLGYKGVCLYDGIITSTFLYGECGTGFASWLYGYFDGDNNVIAQVKDGAWSDYDYHVRPMAMIRDGKIVKESGTPVQNGHQMKDVETGGETLD